MEKEKPLRSFYIEDKQYRICEELWDEFPKAKRISICEWNSKEGKPIKKQGIFSIKTITKGVEAILEDEQGNELKLPLDRFYFTILK